MIAHKSAYNIGCEQSYVRTYILLFNVRTYIINFVYAIDELRVIATKKIRGYAVRVFMIDTMYICHMMHVL